MDGDKKISAALVNDAFLIAPIFSPRQLTAVRNGQRRHRERKGRRILALLKKRYGAHLSEPARKTLISQWTMPSPQVLRNPITRNLVKRIVETEWASTLSQIDFPYTIEDEEFAGVKCVRYRAARADPADPLIIYIHAGGFIAGSARINAGAVLPVCHLTGFEAVGVDYSLAPGAVYPTQLDEIERIYRAILASGRTPSQLILMGDSAGGALVLSSLLRWRQKGAPLPAGVVVMSPVVDATSRSDTHLALKGRDPIFGATGIAGIAAIFDLYAPGQDRSNPDISPIEGDFSGLPPMLVHVGSREIFLGDSARLAEKARRGGVDVSLQVFDGLFHLFHLHWSLDETKAAHADIAAFVHKTIGAARLAPKRAVS